VLKLGSAGPAVRRVQRALNAASPTAQLAVSGVFSSATTNAVRAWQDGQELPATGIMAGSSWTALASGAR
jgi:peptidoglycan hydrolase-like protein with peptidoglycan-binding domain